MIKINETMRDIKCNIIIPNGLNIIMDDSGTGKTFGFNVILSFCELNNIFAIKIDYNSIPKNIYDVMYLFRGADVVIIDNADLFVNNDFMKQLCKCNIPYIIMSLKSNRHLKGIKYNEYMLILDKTASTLIGNRR